MQETKTIATSPRLQGEISIPGDKSISHRSVMFAGLADTPVLIRNFLYAQDCLSTVSCMKALGVEVEKKATGELVVCGKGLHGLKEPGDILDAGNSGTTLRLLSGILAGQPFFSVLTGDASLRKRPLGRVAKPLSLMGGQLIGRDQNRYIPVAIAPPATLQGINYIMPMASAQVKSAILLATLFAETASTVTEPAVSRDHTERMLETFGVPVERDGTSVTVAPPQRLVAPAIIEVPGDISSAAFWLVAASIIPNSDLYLKNVGMNPTRTGIIDVLRQMGADITLYNERCSGAEPVADIRVKTAPLCGVTIEGEMIPRLIDEIPILAVAALFAEGTTVIRGAEELRVKETDRIAAVAQELGKMGAVIEEQADGMIINGRQSLSFATCYSHHDHRMAMALAVAGAAAQGVAIIEPNCTVISYPDFYQTLERISHS